MNKYNRVTSCMEFVDRSCITVVLYLSPPPSPPRGRRSLCVTGESVRDGQTTHTAAAAIWSRRWARRRRETVGRCVFGSRIAVVPRLALTCMHKKKISLLAGQCMGRRATGSYPLPYEYTGRLRRLVALLGQEPGDRSHGSCSDGDHRSASVARKVIHERVRAVRVQ